MGTSVDTTSPDIPGTNNVVVPYGADIDASVAGTVRYTQFRTSHYQMSTVSSFIRSQTSDSFYGTRMMVAEWNGVPKFGGFSVSLNIILFACSLCNHAGHQ